MKANVPLVLNSRDSVNGLALRQRPYQATTYAADHQNLVQGEIREITLAEINFPYDIPNVQSDFNYFFIFNILYPGYHLLPIFVPPGFYTGAELAAAIQAIILQFGVDFFIAAGDLPTIAYSAVSNQFTFTAPPAPTDPQYSELLLSSRFVYSPDANYLYGRDLLSIMGFYRYQGYELPGRFTIGHPITGGSAPLVFTEYIDICSPQLCQYQFLRDGTTTNFARRIDLICRLYISNNIAIAEATVPGTRPFIINRQYTNSRAMRWTAGSSIGQMDLNLFDELGEPLQITWQPRPFQITFNVYEQEKA